MNRNELVMLILKYLDRLRKGMTQQDVFDGWTEQSRAAMIRFFETMVDEAQRGQSLDKLEYKTIPRGMDHWGIYQGDLLENAAEISAAIIDGVGGDS